MDIKYTLKIETVWWRSKLINILEIDSIFLQIALRTRKYKSKEVDF